ncbi:MAG: family NAD(P)-dependent oxidoreductase [Novosphingobium sp.]|nr:family NAD(P)-dependent oxidoreductase [Novosphingobium sp.]
MSFADKYGPWALITGASEGTGAAFARQIAAEGINLILVARREGPLAELAEQVRALGVECITASVDLSRTDAAEKIAAVAGDREVGLFVANAGADTNGSNFLETDAANWDQLININVVAKMRNCHHFAAPMKARGRGGIILVGSGAAYGGLSGLAIYCGSKAFALAFGEGLWAEMRHYGVDVLSLILSRTDTPAHRKILLESGQEIPTNMADPEDVARLGLERLPHGPIQNWGETDDTIGMSPNSPAQRRAKILMIEKMSAAYAAPKQDA